MHRHVMYYNEYVSIDLHNKTKYICIIIMMHFLSIYAFFCSRQRRSYAVCQKFTTEKAMVTVMTEWHHIVTFYNMIYTLYTEVY